MGKIFVILLEPGPFTVTVSTTEVTKISTRKMVLGCWCLGVGVGSCGVGLWVVVAWGWWWLWAGGGFGQVLVWLWFWLLAPMAIA